MPQSLFWLTVALEIQSQLISGVVLFGKLLLGFADIVQSVGRLLNGINSANLLHRVIEIGILLGSQLEVFQRIYRVLLCDNEIHTLYKICPRVVGVHLQGFVDVCPSQVVVLLQQVQFGQLHQGT